MTDVASPAAPAAPARDLSPAIPPAATPFPIDASHPTFARALLPGDVLLFNRSSAFNWVIRVKTWSRITHVEVAFSQPRSPGLVAAARNGTGCGFYHLDPNGLALVLRPTPPCPTFDMGDALGWFVRARVQDQGYDWLGLLNFTYARVAGRDNGKMFCSEFATRFLRSGGIDLFPEHDADTIAPRDLLLTPWLAPVWRSPDEWVLYDRAQARARDQIARARDEELF